MVVLVRNIFITLLYVVLHHFCGGVLYSAYVFTYISWIVEILMSHRSLAVLSERYNVIGNVTSL